MRLQQVITVIGAHAEGEVTTSVAGIEAVVTNVGGRAWLTGVSYYGTDPEDPFPQGYRLNDTWLSV